MVKENIASSIVADRVAKIQTHTRVKWHHVPTKQNPADVGSRGGSVVGNDLWENGPQWLKDPTKWPPNQVLEENRELEDRDLRKRARLLRKSKEAMWKCWSQEFVRSLRERHNQRVGKQTSYPKIGQIVIIRDEDKKRHAWKLGVVSRVMKGRDYVIRGASIRTSNGNIERAVQHIYPLELSCDETKWNPNPEAPTFTSRPTRDAAEAAKIRLKQVADAEEN